MTIAAIPAGSQLKALTEHAERAHAETGEETGAFHNILKDAETHNTTPANSGRNAASRQNAGSSPVQKADQPTTSAKPSQGDKRAGQGSSDSDKEEESSQGGQEGTQNGGHDSNGSDAAASTRGTARGKAGNANASGTEGDGGGTDTTSLSLQYGGGASAATVSDDGDSDTSSGSAGSASEAVVAAGDAVSEVEVAAPNVTGTEPGASAAAGGKNSAVSATSDGGGNALSGVTFAEAAMAANNSGGAAPAGNAAQAGGAGPSAEAEQSVDQANLARVARGLQTAMQQNGGTVTLRLQPPELGVVRVLMEIRNGMTNVQIQTEHEGVQNLLSHQLDSLRGALENHGLGVNKLEVQTVQRQTIESGATPQTPDEGRSRGQYAGDSGTPREQPRQNASQTEDQAASSFAQAMVNVVA